MSTIRLVPKTEPTQELSQGDKVQAVLTRAVEVANEKTPEGGVVRGALVILWREFPDDTGTSVWLTGGLNMLEVLGLLQKTTHDMQEAAYDEVEFDGQ